MNNVEQKRIAIIHPHLRTVGGSELRPAWIAQALKKKYGITLITMGNVDLSFINNYSGTNLEKEEIEIISIPTPALFRRRFAALRNYRLARYCLKNSDSFDLMISTYNVMSFKKRGIQFIADFSFNDSLRQYYHRPDHPNKDVFYRASILRKAYMKLSYKLNKLNKYSWLSNTTIANSIWTRDIIKKSFGIQADVIYPPVPDVIQGGPLEERENGFVYLGRISSEKRIIDIIRIIKNVREKDKSIHLHLVGPIDDSAYGRVIMGLTAENREWLSWEGILVGREKYSFLRKHRFGITGRLSEPFGIAPAEQAKSGCLVWVPNSGGQIEIVDHPMLVYNDVKDAIEKITYVLKSISLMKELREHLLNRSRRFSPEVFACQVEELVNNHFKAEAQEVS